MDGGIGVTVGLHHARVVTPAGGGGTGVRIDSLRATDRFGDGQFLEWGSIDSWVQVDRTVIMCFRVVFGWG